MKGFEEAFRGRAMSNLPEELITAIAASGGASLSVRLRQGDPVAIHDAVAIVADPKAKLEDRLLYTRIFGEVRSTDAVPMLLKLVPSEGDIAMRKAAMVSLGAYDNGDIPTRVLDELPKLPAELRAAAFALLDSRPAWTQMLIARLQEGKVSTTLVHSEVVDRLRNHPDKNVVAVALKLFPKAPDSGYDFKTKLEQVEVALKSASGNPYAGEPIFTERCATCHKLFFKGGNIGPELTSYQRDNLGTMLISIINPNAEIREGYQWLNVQTTDGRVLNGFQVDRDNQATVIRGLDGQNVTIAARDIKDMQPVGRSVMPEGLLEGLNEQQLRDLFAYLRISQPISR
jgi:putative heme-binding domain-containing protein